VKARLFRSDAMVERDGIEREIVLESEWFQLTYNTLRSAPDGDSLAHFDTTRDAWYLTDDEDGHSFSDIVIFEPNEYEQEV